MLRENEILPHIWVREDGLVKNTRGHGKAKSFWHDGCDDGKGYKVIRSAATTCGEKTKIRYIHRLVAEAFVANPENKQCVDHIDGNIENNRADNLRWVTRRENQQNLKCHREGRLVGCCLDQTAIRNNLRKVWRAGANKAGKSIYLGHFATEQEAHEAYLSYIKQIKG